MAAVTPESPTQYHVRFADLGRRGLGRVLRAGAVQVDPYLIGRALAEVMRACTVRGASGRRLLWNEYRVVLARGDFEPLRALAGPLDRDLTEVLTRAVKERHAELVGPLRVHLVVEEGHELEPGHAVVRVAFSPAERLAAPADGELTVGLDAWAAGRRPAPPPHGGGRAQDARDGSTVHVAEAAEAGRRCRLAWDGGEAILPAGVTVVLGRPHAEPPPHFVALLGASTRVSKQHAWVAVGPAAVTIGRFSTANPVHVNGAPVPAAGEVTTDEPLVEISLSRGDLVLSLHRV
ncbi:MAG TPA: FhaA domain-containing protein [Polyangia bacterium]|jgi:hypothetical protein